MLIAIIHIAFWVGYVLMLAIFWDDMGLSAYPLAALAAFEAYWAHLYEHERKKFLT